MDESHSCNIGVEGYKLYRRDTQGRKGGGVALYVKKLIDGEALTLRNSQEQVGSLWVKIKDRTNKGHFVVGVYYRPPDQGESVDEVFFPNYRKPSVHRLSSSCAISTTQMSAGKVAWQSVSNPGDSWSPLRTTSSSRY